MVNEAEFVFKIVAVGSGGVGKTSLIRRFALNKFGTNYVMTLGVDFTTKELTVFDKFVKIVCVDTAGQEYYGRIRPSYYSGATAAFIVFDLTNKNSFESLPKWISELRQYLPTIPIAIVGNKLDLARENNVARRIDESEAMEFSKQNDMAYFETSAKEGDGVDHIFLHLSEKVLAKTLHS
jgi:small GTP-binding protein